jgi:hypothetical protein
MTRFSEQAVLELDPRLRLFTVLLTAASLIIVATALASRALVSRLAARARQPLRSEDTPRLGAGSEAAMWQQLRHQADAAHMGARPALAPRITRQQIATAIDSIDIQDLTWSSGFPLPQKQRGMPGWLVAVLSIITLVAVGAVSHRAWLWNKNREAQLAMQAQADAERQAREFEEQRVLRAREAEEAQKRLTAALAAPQQPADSATTTPVLMGRGTMLAEAMAAAAPIAPAAASVDEQKKKAELEAQADREAQAAREAEAKAAREAEKAEKAQLAAQAKADRDAREAAQAEERRAAREAKEAREAERDRRREQRELRERYVAQRKAKEKAKVEQKERASRDKAVGGMLDGNRDPIFGL